MSGDFFKGNCTGFTLFDDNHAKPRQAILVFIHCRFSLRFVALFGCYESVCFAGRKPRTSVLPFLVRSGGADRSAIGICC